MNLLGGSLTSSSAGEELQSGKVNYFTGNDKANWHPDVSVYGRVRLHQVYPGIDLTYYGHQGQLEYDFIVAPGADAAAIHVRFDGATPQLAGNGDLVLPVNGNEVRFHQPVVYQTMDGKRHPVEGAFQMAKNDEVSFHLGPYDRSRELVIDPTLVYTGTFGTASESDAPAGMAVDAQGELIITGTTLDDNFPATSGAYQTSCGPVSATDTSNGVFRCATGDQPGAMSSAYVMKLSADGTQLVYATYLHGITGWEEERRYRPTQPATRWSSGKPLRLIFPWSMLPRSRRCLFVSRSTRPAWPAPSSGRPRKTAPVTSTAAVRSGQFRAPRALSRS